MSQSGMIDVLDELGIATEDVLIHKAEADWLREQLHIFQGLLWRQNGRIRHLIGEISDQDIANSLYEVLSD